MTLGECAKKYYVEEGLNCAVSVLLGASEVYNLGVTKQDAKLITAFGGGMGCGDLCGCLAGAMAALGKVFLPEDAMYSPKLKEICADFVAEFNAKWGTYMCGKIKEENANDIIRCGDVVKASGDLLQNYIESRKD